MGLVWHQRLEKDEGYLTEGAWLVANGRLPYRDFVFPQQPYFPLVYGALLRLAGPSLLWARSLSAVFFLALAALVFAFVRRHADAQLARWAALLLCFNTLSLYWYPRARQYALADLLLFAALLLLAEARSAAPRRRALLGCLLAGVCAGAAAQVRLVVGPAVLVLAVASGLGPPRSWSWRRALAFVVGAALGSLPFLWLLALDPNAWLQDAYRLQTLMRPQPEAGSVALQVGRSLKEFFALPELALLALCAGTAVAVGGGRLRGGLRLALVVLVVVAGTALLTHPTQGQYLVETLPCLAVLAALGLGRLRDRLARGSSRAARALPGVLLLVALGLGSYRAAGRILYDHHHDPKLGMAGFLAYQEHMRAHVRPDDRSLLTWWPGYLLVEGVEPYPGAELGRPTERALARLSPEGFAAIGLRHPETIARDLRAGVPRFVVVGYQAPEDAPALLSGRYRLRARFGAIEVHERCDTAEGQGACRP